MAAVTSLSSSFTRPLGICGTATCAKPFALAYAVPIPSPWKRGQRAATTTTAATRAATTRATMRGQRAACSSCALLACAAEILRPKRRRELRRVRCNSKDNNNSNNNDINNTNNNSPCQPDSLGQDLARWLVEEGGRVSPAVAVYSAGGDLGRGLICIADVEPHQVLVSVPRRCQLQWAESEKECSAAHWQVQRMIEQEVCPEMWDVRLALLLLSAQQGVLQSEWPAYLPVLPKDPPDLPIFWSEARLQEASS
ncbi:unnamed protein product, partial [Polarella glacialis]